MLSTYEGLAREPLKTPLLACHWGAVILDEAQRIRNPDTEASQCCRRLKAVHRIALSGTPVQNSLTELWSLFDFVYPGRLGRLPSFEEEFALPIRAGGFKNAAPAQVQAAKRQAESLRLLVTPFLLRRLKKDVMTTSTGVAASSNSTTAASASGSAFQKFAMSSGSRRSSTAGRHDHNEQQRSQGSSLPQSPQQQQQSSLSQLPPKSEQVLFCKLSPAQRRLYEEVLQSKEMKAVLDGRAKSFRVITLLRKVGLFCLRLLKTRMERSTAKESKNGYTRAILHNREIQRCYIRVCF